MSHTSLPSHSGPIVAMAARRPASSLPTTPCSIPTPRSKPSSTKKPVQRMAMTANQTVSSGMSTSVRHGWHADGLVHLGRGRRRDLATSVLHHELDVHDGEK